MSPIWRRRLGLLLLAFVLCLSIKSEILDLRLVPSSSMSPTLEQGDWVLIDKWFGRWGSPRRYDLAVFRRPDGEGQFVKRIVGLPGSTVQILDGDLYCNGKIAAKSIEEFRGQAVRLFDSRKDPWEGAWYLKSERVISEVGGAVRLRSGGLGELAMLFRKGLYLTLEESDDEKRQLPPEAHDAVLSGSFFAPEKGLCHIVLGEAGDRFDFELRFQNGAISARILRTRGGAEEVLRSSSELPLDRNRPHDFCVGNVDNRLFFLLDGERFVLPYDYERNHPFLTQEKDQAAFPPSPVSISFEDGELQLLWLALDRDVDYANVGEKGVEEPLSLGEEEYFFLGDHSTTSRDSRFFGPVRRSEILGKAIAIVWPISRSRKL